MIEKYGLKELKLPWGLGLKDMDKTKIVMSPDFLRPSKENMKRTALILIQGSQAEFGLWSNSVSITENLEVGSMLPQIDWAVKQKDYSVLVMNPNRNDQVSKKEKIPFNEDFLNHANYVWTNYVIPGQFGRLLILANREGGKCV